MTIQQKIKEAINRSTKALTLRPSLGLGTGVSKTKITQGLSCEITEGPYRFTADMPASVGGNSTGPTPGVYGRAAIGSCLAIGYMMEASRMDIKVRSLEVEIQADFDDGVLIGTSKGLAGYEEVRYQVSIECDASKNEVFKMLDEADSRSPYLDVFSRAQKCIRIVHFNSKNHAL